MATPRNSSMPVGPTALLVLASLLAWTGAAGAGGAQVPAAPGERPVAVSGPPGAPLCSFSQLARLPWPELERLYRDAAPGVAPDGYARGHVFYPPDEPLANTRVRLAALVWQGKHFCAAEGVLVNQWLGLRAIRARVSYGPSWLDGGPALILDYRQTSRLWADVRDEMREVGPGLYLGVMYLRRCPEPRLKLFFALEAEPRDTCRPGH